MNEGKPPVDLEWSFLVKMVREWYDFQILALHKLPSDSEKDIFQVDLANGASGILRIVEDSSKETLVELVRLLMFFEQNNYPAERIMLTIEQTPMGAVSGWHMVMTTFLRGIPVASTPANFSLLGAILGRLHALKPFLTYLPPSSNMLPSGEIAFAQQRLASVAPIVPHHCIAQYEWLEKALSLIDPR